MIILVSCHVKLYYKQVLSTRYVSFGIPFTGLWAIHEEDTKKASQLCGLLPNAV